VLVVPVPATNPGWKLAMTPHQLLMSGMQQPMRSWWLLQSTSLAKAATATSMNIAVDQPE